MLSLPETAHRSDTFPAADRSAIWPWQAEPYRLWSLLEMLQYTARTFYWVGLSLSTIKGDCLAASAVVLDGEAGFNLSQALDSMGRQKALKHLARVEPQCRSIGMSITADLMKDLIEELQADRPQATFDWLHSQVNTLEKVADRELKGKVFLYIPAERFKLWPTAQSPWGDDVAAKFSSATFDIYSAGKSLATGLPTAAVFHLMRVMEIGLASLGRVFGVSLERTNWAPAIGEIESKIRAMHTTPEWRQRPDCRQQQEFYADAAAGFGIIKDAWRNHAMHARAKYADDEAELIFMTVKAFMEKLATRLSDELPSV